MEDGIPCKQMKLGPKDATVLQKFIFVNESHAATINFYNNRYSELSARLISTKDELNERIEELENKVSDVGEKLEDKTRQCNELSNKLFDRDTAFVKEREIGCALRNEVKELKHENSKTVEELRAKDKQIG